jgi:hypothetical protein
LETGELGRLVDRHLKIETVEMVFVLRQFRFDVPLTLEPTLSLANCAPHAGDGTNECLAEVP